MTKPSDIVSGAAAGAVLAFGALSTIAAGAWIVQTLPTPLVVAAFAAGVTVGALSSTRRDRTRRDGDEANRRPFTVIVGADDHD